MQSQCLEELDKTFIIEGIEENSMKMKNNFPGFYGILVEMWKKFSNKNKKGAGMLMDIITALNINR